MRAPVIALFVILFATLALSAAPEGEVMQIPVSKIGRGTVVLGDLRQPIGKTVTIHGKKGRNANSIGFFVDSVDAEKLNPPIPVYVSGIEEWPDGTTATFVGYEVGTIRYLHINDTNYGSEKEFQPRQTVFLTFHYQRLLEKDGRSVERSAKRER